MVAMLEEVVVISPWPNKAACVSVPPSKSWEGEVSIVTASWPGLNPSLSMLLGESETVVDTSQGFCLSAVLSSSWWALLTLPEEASTSVVLTFGISVLALSPKLRKAVGKTCIDGESPETAASSSPAKSVAGVSVSSVPPVRSLPN